MCALSSLIRTLFKLLETSKDIYWTLSRQYIAIFQEFLCLVCYQYKTSFPNQLYMLYFQMFFLFSPTSQQMSNEVKIFGL